MFIHFLIPSFISHFLECMTDHYHNAEYNANAHAHANDKIDNRLVKANVLYYKRNKKRQRQHKQQTSKMSTAMQSAATGLVSTN